jgi:hypothetical protein
MPSSTFGFRVGAELGERSTDLVETVDLAEDAIHVLLQDAIEIRTAVLVGATQVLHPESDRREGVLNLVGDLTGHLSPGEHALRTREVLA